MENRWNLLYLGGIYIGTPNDGLSQQGFDVVWDTGSGAYLARSTLCTGCSGDTFDYTRSSTFAFNSPATYDRVTYMDGTSLYGQHATDKVCPVTDQNSCANNFQFVALSSTSGLRDYEDGIIGMWSGNRSGYDTTEMYMYKMYPDSTITERTFSFYMTGLSG